MSNMYGVEEYVRYVGINEDLSDFVGNGVVCVFSTREEAEKFINDIYKLFKGSDDWHEDPDEANAYYFKENDWTTFSYSIIEIPSNLDARQVFDTVLRR